MTEEIGKLAQATPNRRRVYFRGDVEPFEFMTLQSFFVDKLLSKINAAHEKAVAEAREEGRRAGLEEAFQMISGWHLKSGGFTSLAHDVRALKEKKP